MKKSPTPTTLRMTEAMKMRLDHLMKKYDLNRTETIKKLVIEAHNKLLKEEEKH